MHPFLLSVSPGRGGLEIHRMAAERVEEGMALWPAVGRSLPICRV